MPSARLSLGRRPIKRIGVAIAAAALWLATEHEAGATASQIPEYHLEAVFLFNFAQFVEWPPGAFPEAKGPLVIGILGDDPFGDYIDETVRGERVEDRPIVVRRFKSIEDVKTCHILYISRSEGGRVEQILARLSERPVLTVSDVDRFNRLGGMIRFVTEGNRVRLRINNNAARSAGLTISSNLLRLSEIVAPRGN